MGKVIYLPGCKPQVSQRELVEQATTILMREVANVFIEQRVEQGPQITWYKGIQNYLWAAPILLDENDEIDPYDLREWKHYWRGQALDYIAIKSSRR